MTLEGALLGALSFVREAFDSGSELLAIHLGEAASHIGLGEAAGYAAFPDPGSEAGALAEGAGADGAGLSSTNFTNFVVIGLTMNIVGTFFLANSIVFKRPRRVIEEFFVNRPGSLLEIRDYIFTKIQVVIGFVFIFCGFGLQIVAHVTKLAEPAPFLLFAILAIFLLAFLIGTVGYATSRRTFKRYLKDFFRRNPWPFAQNMILTQEIGEIFGIPKNPEDTVEMYVAKLRRELRLPGMSEGAGESSSRSGRPLA